MKNAKSIALAEKLSEISMKNYYNPYQELVFPETVDRAQWFTSPELISIYGTEAYERLTENEKKVLSFFEAVNFYSLNIHGEKPLIEGLAKRLHEDPVSQITTYLHHFLDEENKHMVYFGTFCNRYAGKIYPDRKFSLPREYAEGEEELLFFLKTMIFEEIADFYNRHMAEDERLHEVARKINLFHHKDEIRHLVFGRQRVKELFQEHSPRWSKETLENFRSYVNAYLLSTWREYYNPDIYRDAGLADPYGVAESSFASPAARAHRERVTRDCVDRLLEFGVLLEEPRQ